MANQYHFMKGLIMKQPITSESPSNLAFFDQDCAQLITNCKLQSVNYSQTDCVSKDAVRGMDTPSAPIGLAQEGCDASEQDEVYVSEVAQITGIRAQIARNISIETGIETKSSFKCYLTVQTNLDEPLEYRQLTGYLQIRRNNFTRAIHSAEDKASSRALQLYHEYRKSSDEVYLGHCHLRGQKKMIPEMAVVWNRREPQPYFVFFCNAQGYRIDISDQHLSQRQRDSNMLYDGQYGEFKKNPRSRAIGGIDAIMAAPRVKAPGR
jgi:hypothetical protein